MKKASKLFICILLSIVVSGCKKETIECEGPDESSDVYTQTEISNAKEVVQEYFDENFKDCTLVELYYEGDSILKNYEDIPDQYNAKDVIVIHSDIDVGEEGGDGSLNPNSYYEDWNWILVRNDQEEWNLVDWGY